jgi:hypothetical protein
MKESAFWQLVKRNLPEPDEVWERIENTAASGIPDVLIVSSSLPTYFIELKMARGNKVPLRPSQVAWITRASRLHAPIFILVRKEDTIKLFAGKSVIDLVQEGWNTPSLFRTSKPFDWDKLKRLIAIKVLETQGPTL